MLGQRVLPPQTIDACDGSLVLDGLAELLVDDLHLGRGRLAVPDGGETEEIGRKLGAVGVEDEGATHPEGSAEQAGLEDDIVSRRGLTRLGGVRWARARPVVPGEDERREVDLLRQLDETVERR